MNRKMIVQAHHVAKSFYQGETELVVLKGVDAVFEQGTSYAITGVSGTGKSTLLQLLAGLDKPTQGMVTIDGVNITTLSATEREYFLHHTVGLVFQLPYLVKEFSVIENVMFKGLIGGMDTTSCRKQAQELLEKVGLHDKYNAHPLSLSGGQQQRVALARALFNKPKFLFADEPTGNLDDSTGNSIVDLLIACQKEWGMGLIVSSHDAYVAQQMDCVFALKDGILVNKV